MKRSSQMSTIEEIVLALVVLAYAVSFLLPVTDAGAPYAMYGYQAFFWGFASIVYWPQWSANVAFWIACGSFGDRRWRHARNAGAVAVGLAISEVWLWDDPPEVGFYLWMGSMAFLALASAVISVYHSTRPSARTNGRSESTVNRESIRRLSRGGIVRREQLPSLSNQGP